MPQTMLIRSDPDNYLSLARESSPDCAQFFKHCHDGYEFFLLIRGSIDMLTEEKTFALHEGDFLIIRPHDYHIATLKDMEIYDRVIVNATENYFSRCGLREMPTLLADLPEPCFTLREDSFLNGCLQQLPAWIRAMPTPQEQARIFDTVLFAIYAALLLRDTQQKRKAGSPLPPLIQQALEFINIHLSENLSLDSIAGKLFVSKSHLCNSFKNTMGIGVKKYIDHKRISLARSLIAHGMPIKKVFIRCGFNDYTTFYRMYTKITGQSPSRTQEDHLNA